MARDFYPIRYCIKHDHSSEESARKCYKKNVAKRADRRMERAGVTAKLPRYTQIRLSPPKPEPIFMYKGDKPAKIIMMMWFYRGTIVKENSQLELADGWLLIP